MAVIADHDEIMVRVNAPVDGAMADRRNPEGMVNLLRPPTGPQAPLCPRPRTPPFHTPQTFLPLPFLTALVKGGGRWVGHPHSH